MTTPHATNVGRITFLESIRCVRFALWDEAQGRMISFRELRTVRRPSA